MPRWVVEFGKDGQPVEADGRLDATAFHRNHQPIWNVLAPLLAGQSGDVVEVGSGTGQHVCFFAEHAPAITWWPSDLNEAHLKSIAAWRSHLERSNVRAPMRIDLTDPAWGEDMQRADAPRSLLAVFCANVVHIAPWAVAEGLIAGAARYLRPDGMLILYGPFKRGGQHTSESNAAFDASLRSGNPEWGVRDVEDLSRVAETVGLACTDAIDMPANNLTLIFRRRTP